MKIITESGPSDPRYCVDPNHTATKPCAAVLDLHRRIKEIEEGDGTWNGGDTVDVLTQWFGDHGIPIRDNAVEDDDPDSEG